MSASAVRHRIAPLLATVSASSSSRIALRPIALGLRASSTQPARAAHAPTTTTVRAAPNAPPAPAAASASSSSAPPSASSSATTSDKAPPKPRRTFKAKKAALKMTPEAVTRLRALQSNPTEPKLLRIGVKTRGCAGMAYHLDYVDPPGGKFDEVVEQDGVKVLIDSKALFSIIGSTMDWRDNRLSAGFVFENPNIVDTCGCGESFNIKF